MKLHCDADVMLSVLFPLLSPVNSSEFFFYFSVFMTFELANV